MCLIIFSPKIQESDIDPAVLERAFAGNKNGAGFAYLKGGNVIVDKGYFTFKAFKKRYDDIVSSLKGPLLIHFRLSTSGKDNRENCHPFVIKNNKLVMAHNGVFSELSFDKSKVSDTYRFAKMLTEMDWKFPYNEAQQILLNMACGSYNKLVFLDNKGDYVIINENEGVWKKNTWYSNKNSFEVKLSRFRRKQGGGFEELREEQDELLALQLEYGDLSMEDYITTVPWLKGARRRIIPKARSIMNERIGARIDDPDFHHHTVSGD